MRFDAQGIAALKAAPLPVREQFIGLLPQRQQHKARMACMSREELEAWCLAHPFDRERLEKACAKRERKAGR